jgi:hypothetical protein
MKGKIMISEIWTSMGYVMPNTGYYERAMANGVIDANDGDLPDLSFKRILKKLGEYFEFSEIERGVCDYTRGNLEGITIEVTYEVSSDLTKRLSEEEDSVLCELVENEPSFDKVVEALLQSGTLSVPLICAKLSYQDTAKTDLLDRIRKTLLNSGLEKI